MRVVTLVTPALGIIVAAGLSGCASSSRLDQSSTAVKVAANLPPPDSTTVPVDITPYRIGPGDELDVKVFGAPDLDRTGVVDAAGDFLLPLAGAVQAAGKTPEEFADAIEARLQGRYLKNPQVAVNFKQVANQRALTIDGEVQQPGIYPIRSHMTLQQAIATAHGATDVADIRNVVIFRTVDGQKMGAMFDLKAIRSGRFPDPEVYGNDIVVVGQSAIQKFLHTPFFTVFGSLGSFVPVIFK